MFSGHLAKLNLFVFTQTMLGEKYKFWNLLYNCFSSFTLSWQVLVLYYTSDFFNAYNLCLRLKWETQFYTHKFKNARLMFLLFSISRAK